jgi:hypothetical protein
MKDNQLLENLLKKHGSVDLCVIPVAKLIFSFLKLIRTQSLREEILHREEFEKEIPQPWIPMIY